MDTAELTRQERAIAAKYRGGFPWLMAFWGVGNSCVWVALWPLTLMGLIPLWLTFIVATANVMLSYLPSHDAQHDIFVARGSKLHWINELIGHVSIFPLVLAFRTARETHLGHHRHANDPALDPDYPSHAPNAWAALWKTIENRQHIGRVGVNLADPVDRQPDCRAEFSALGEKERLVHPVIARIAGLQTD